MRARCRACGTAGQAVHMSACCTYVVRGTGERDNTREATRVYFFGVPKTRVRAQLSAAEAPGRPGPARGIRAQGEAARERLTWVASFLHVSAPTHSPATCTSPAVSRPPSRGGRRWWRREHALWPRVRDLFAPNQAIRIPALSGTACGECRGIAQGDMPTACGPTADVGRSRDGRARGSKPFVF